MGSVVFFMFVLVTVIPGIILVFSKNLVYSIFLLFTSLIGLAGLYIFAQAKFLAISQIVLYVGGVLVILLFGVLLTHKVREINPSSEIINIVPAVILTSTIGLGLFLLLESFMKSIVVPQTISKSGGLFTIGKNTLTTYLLPFEFASIILLVALIGAVVVSSNVKSNPK